jgi:3-dehydroquinate synthase
MSVLTIRRPAGRTILRVERGLIGRAGPLIAALGAGPRVEIVTDSTVGRHYAPRMISSMRRAGLRFGMTVLAPGERSKSLKSAARLYDRWARAGADRTTLVVALGGGVVGDLAGFAAATYARGLPWIIFPTTLLAQADASVGGKVAVNLEQGKNLIGAYHHPRAVFSDPEALATLSDRAYRSGLAEVAKMGMVSRPAILASLARLLREGRLRDAAAILPLIRACAREKARIVARDERDRGVRRLLNFGHTVGHALEAAEGYGRYTHGEAVAVGMAAALRMSVLEAGLDPVSAAEAEFLLSRLGLPTRLRKSPGKRFWDALARDKKRGRAALRMVLSPAIGEAKVFELPSLTTLRRVIESLVRSG